jgi:hypothetical protein
MKAKQQTEAVSISATMLDGFGGTSLESPITTSILREAAVSSVVRNP